MSVLRFNKVAAPSTPAASKAEIYISNDALPHLRTVDEYGNNYSVPALTNASTTSQSITAATRTYITGSLLNVPATKLRVGAIFKWIFNITKTAAGTATSTFDVCVGTAGTTADTARLSFTKPIGTAAADEGRIEIIAVVRSIGASGVMCGEFVMVHNLASTGHATIPCVVVNSVSAGFDMTVASLKIGVCITSGTGDVITIQMVKAEAINL